MLKFLLLAAACLDGQQAEGGLAKLELLSLAVTNIVTRSLAFILILASLQYYVFIPLVLILLANTAVFRWLPERFDAPGIHAVSSKLCSILLPTSIPQSPSDKERTPPSQPSLGISGIRKKVKNRLKRKKTKKVVKNKNIEDDLEQSSAKIKEPKIPARLENKGDVQLAAMSLCGVTICLACLVLLVVVVQEPGLAVSPALRLTAPQLLHLTTRLGFPVGCLGLLVSALHLLFHSRPQLQARLTKSRAVLHTLIIIAVAVITGSGLVSCPPGPDRVQGALPLSTNHRIISLKFFCSFGLDAGPAGSA